MAQLTNKQFVKVKLNALVFGLALLITACNQHSINIKTYKLTSHDIADIGHCFYFDSKDSIKDVFLSFNEGLGYITINNKQVIFCPDDITILDDPKYLGVVKYKNKDYTVILKVNRADSTRKHFWKGVMVVKNVMGDSIVRNIEGRL